MKVGPADDDGARGLLAYLDDKAYICPKPEVWFGLLADTSRTSMDRWWVGTRGAHDACALARQLGCR